MKILDILIQFFIAVFLIYILHLIVKSLNVGIGYFFVIIAAGVAIIWLFRELKVI